MASAREKDILIDESFSLCPTEITAIARSGIAFQSRQASLHAFVGAKKQNILDEKPIPK